MQLLSVIAALKRNKLGILLIGFQVALTLAVVSNAVSIVSQALQRANQPSGVAEAELVTFRNEWIGAPQDLEARLQADLETLRGIRGVVDAYATNSFPLQGGGSVISVSVAPDQKDATAGAALYIADEHTLRTLGSRILAGRWFAAEDVSTGPQADGGTPSQITITQTLAQKLFPGGAATGKTVYIGGQPATIIGVTTPVAIPWGNGPIGTTYADSALFFPRRLLEQSYFYVVRTSESLSATIRTTRRELLKLERRRVIDRVKSFAEVRQEAYSDDVSAATILTAACVLLLAATTLGIVGLTQYWVDLRRHQIGVRRALGADRGSIVRYFLIENVLIVAAGASAGVVMAAALNLWIVENFDATRLGLRYLLLAGGLVLALGQLAVLWPALRAASIDPAIATRSL